MVECGWFVDDGEEYGDEGDSDRGGIEGIGIWVFGGIEIVGV